MRRCAGDIVEQNLLFRAAPVHLAKTAETVCRPIAGEIVGVHDVDPGLFRKQGMQCEAEKTALANSALTSFNVAHGCWV